MAHAKGAGGKRPLHQLTQGQQLDNLLAEYRPRLRRMIALRLDPRLRARFDASDVVQEAYIEVSRRVLGHQAAPEMSFFLWVRQIATQKLIDLHRKHMGAEKRDVRLEVPLPESGLDSAVSLAHALTRDASSPSRRAIRAERVECLREALEGMQEIDREILLLRHFEGLAFRECALILGITTGAAKVRHLRAVERLGEIFRRQGGEDEFALPPTPSEEDDGE